MKTLLVTIAMIATALCVNAQQYSYDAAGRLTKVIYSNGLETRYTYDKNGNIVAIKTDVINSVEENAKQTLMLTATPNPATDNIVLRMEDRNNERVDINVVNSAGVVVLRMSRVVQNNECTIDVRALASGAYTLQCESGSMRGAQKIVVAR